MGASWSLIFGYHISLEDRCLQNPDSGISGLPVRIAVAIVSILCIIVFVILAATHKSQSTTKNKFREKLKAAFKDVTAVQLVMADAYLITALINQYHTSWNHLRFVGDYAVLSCLPAAMLSLLYRRKGIEFKLHLANVLVFIGLFISSAFVYLNKVAEALREHPGCYDERFYTECKPYIIIFGTIVILVLLVPACIPSRLKLSSWFTVPFCVLTSLLIIVDIYISFTDYEVMKPMLRTPETKTDVGQTFTLLSTLLALSYALYKNFVVPLGENPQGEQGKTHTEDQEEVHTESYELHLMV